MIVKCKRVLPAPSGIQERKVYIYLPKGYDGVKRFPVIYMFDGQTAFYDKDAPFGHSWNMGKTLDKLKAPFIVAAVFCDEKDRLSEYSPYPFESRFGKSQGLGKGYMDWFSGEFKEYVDEHYLTLPDRENTFLLGSSMGGLMTFYSLVEYGGIYGGGGALSPSFWVNPTACVQLAENVPQNTKLYFSYGEKELKNHAPQARTLARINSVLIGRGLPFFFRIKEGGIHSETTWAEQVPEIIGYFLDKKSL